MSRRRGRIFSYLAAYMLGLVCHIGDSSVAGNQLRSSRRLESLPFPCPPCPMYQSIYYFFGPFRIFWRSYPRRGLKLRILYLSIFLFVNQIKTTPHTTILQRKEFHSLPSLGASTGCKVALSSWYCFDNDADSNTQHSIALTSILVLLFPSTERENE